MTNDPFAAAKSGESAGSSIPSRGSFKGNRSAVAADHPLAASTGAQILKLQTYTADTMTLDIKDGDFLIKDKNLWSGKTLHKLYQEAYTPWEWHEPIIKKAKELGMLCFSSVFDGSAVDFLEKLNVPAYKMCSRSIIP